MKIIYTIKYIFERIFPYVIALVITVLCWYYKFNIMNDEDYKELLNGLVTLDSIIVGFLGTIIPIISSMKNESKFVRYVFEKDTENLFCKYLKVTVLFGILNAVISLVMHVRKVIPLEFRMKIYFCWIFITVTFLTTTYRCMSYMISLVFTKDENKVENNEVNNVHVSDSRRKELREKFNNKNN